MYLDSNEITKLNAIISNSLLNNKNYVFSNNAINILLKEANHTIKILGHKRFIDPGIIQYVLVIGTILRKANENEAKIVAKSYFDLIRRIIKNEDEIGAIAKIRFYTFMCLNLLNTYPSVIENKGSLLWADEKDKIDDFLKNQQKQIDFKLTEFEEKFDIEMRTLNTAYVISEDIQFYVNALIEKLKDNSTTKDPIIKNALFYLMEKDDLVNDDLGVFGLVDDYYALEKAYSKVNVSNLSTDLLKEFLVFEDDSLYTVFEKGKYLETLNPQLQFILASFNYLIKSSSDNIVFVVPSSNIIVLLIIIQFFIKNNYNESVGNKELQKGDDLYFLLPKDAIQGFYDGTFEHDKNKGVIKNDKGEFITLDKFSIRMAARSPQGRTKISSDITKISKTWSNLKRNFIPPHISIKKNLKINLFYLTKKFFDENIKELRPYGLEYRDLISYIYFKESEDIRQIEEQILTKEFLFNVMSDPGKLYSIVLLLIKKEHTVTILSDESELIDEFLSYISDYDLELRKKT